MAAPITHIVLAEKVFKKHFAQKNKAEFLVGTSLPDIRHFDNIDRDKTHFLGLALADIKNEDSFLAGLKFHSLTDELHDRFFSYKDNPFFLEPIHLTATSLKFFEDEFLYDRLSNWPEIIRFFDVILEEESKYDDQSDLLAWHQSLQVYLAKAPNFESRRAFFRTTEFSDDLAEQVEGFLDQMKKMPQVRAAAQEFYDNFEQLL